MIDRALEPDLQRHFHDRLDGELAPATLVSAVGVIPRMPGRWAFPHPLGLGRPMRLLAIAGLSALLVVGAWAVGSALLEDEPRQLSLPGTDACSLLSEEFLEGMYGSEVVALVGYPETNWSPYSRDWWVPRGAVRELGPSTRDCSFVKWGVGSQELHLELFVRTESTDRIGADRIAQRLFEQGELGFISRSTPIEVAGYPGWRTQNREGNHVAYAVLAGRWLLVMSISAVGDADRMFGMLDVIAGEVIQNLGRP
jgi:hypothetical protein